VLAGEPLGASLTSLGRSWMFTGGSEGVVRFLPAAAQSATQPLQADEATKPITWIDVSRRLLVTASQDGAVRIYEHAPAPHERQEPTDLVNVLLRTALPTRCVALERYLQPGREPRVAVCSDELIVKLVDAGAPARIQLLTKHTRPVRAAAWSPRESLLVTTDCDGTARVWDCSPQDPVEVSCLEGIVSRESVDSEMSSEPVWHPDGSHFVLPSKTHDIAVISSAGSSWSRSAVYSPQHASIAAEDRPAGQITALAFSPNGRYLASATTQAHVTVWDTSSRRPVRSRRAEALVSGISWCADADALAWVDTLGQLTRWSDVVGATMASPCEPVDFSAQAGLRQAARNDIDELFDGAGLDDSDEEDREQTVSERRSKHARAGDDDLEGFLVDDEGAYGRNGRSARHSSRRATAKEGSSLASTATQAPFQPTSTPMKAQRRFLAFSTLGSLVATDQEGHQTVAFESFDAAARRNWRFADHAGYHLASLGSTGALFASAEKVGGDGETSPSMVYYKPFEAAGAGNVPGAEWSASLQSEESAVAVAMAGRAAAGSAAAASGALNLATAVVATSRGYLRFFSASGLQRYVWALGSTVVCLAAGDRRLLVVHRAGTPVALNGFQSLSYTLIDLLTFGIVQEGTLPLGRDVQLQWAGFDLLDAPAIFDSQGVLYVLDRAHSPRQGRWTPVLETRSASMQSTAAEGGASSRLTYWPVGLGSTKLYSLILKGHASPDPAAQARPLIQETEFRLPLLNQDTPSGALEQQHLLAVRAADAMRAGARLRRSDASRGGAEDDEDIDESDAAALDHSADKALLQLIQLACKSDRHGRALDAARELHTAKTLDAALQIASFFHQTSLAERMASLKEWVDTRAERDAQNDALLHSSAYAGVVAQQREPSPDASVERIRAARRALGQERTQAPRKSYGAAKLTSSAAPTYETAAPRPREVDATPAESVPSTSNVSARSQSPEWTNAQAGLKRKTSDLEVDEQGELLTHCSPRLSRRR
jgi:chromosome transmission fidelity protein 4